MRTWVRWYTEIVDDIKLAELSDRQFRLFGLLVALAGRIDRNGELPPTNEIAWLLRLSYERTSDDMLALEAAGLLAARGDNWTLTWISEPENLRPPSDVWARLRIEVFERDGYRCHYCGAHAEPPECDHVIPVSQGGSSDPDNLVTACRYCNRSKGDRRPEEWRL